MIIEWTDKDAILGTVECTQCGDEVVYYFQKTETFHGEFATDVEVLEDLCHACYERVNPTPL